MAQSSVTTVNETTPTLLFSGDGLVWISQEASASSVLLIGGAGVSQSNGCPWRTAGKSPMRILSPDDIYGLARTGSGSFDINVFSCR